VDQKMLIDGVEVEEKNQAHQASDGLRQHTERIEVVMKVRVRKKKGGQPNGEQKSDYGRRCPQPPFPPFNSPEVCSEGLPLRVSQRAQAFWSMKLQKSPVGIQVFAPQVFSCLAYSAKLLTCFMHEASQSSPCCLYPDWT
jgi:hypothetical protein